MVQNRKGSTTVLLPHPTMCASLADALLFSMSAQLLPLKEKNFRSVELHLLSIFRMQVKKLGLQTYCLFHAIPKSWNPINKHTGLFSFCLIFLDVWKLHCDQSFFCPQDIDLSIPPEGYLPIHVVLSGTCKIFKSPEMVMMTFFCSMMRALLIRRYSSTPLSHASQAESA